MKSLGFKILLEVIKDLDFYSFDKINIVCSVIYIVRKYFSVK
jgi:hypothetical protein